jgi:hypothetical protein
MLNKCHIHKIAVLGECPKCAADAPAVKQHGRKDRGMTPLFRLGVIRKRPYHADTPAEKQPNKA